MVGLILVGGVWADRLERRRIMLAADVMRVVIQLILATLVLSGNVELWEILVLQLFYGTAQAFFGPASTGIIPQILPDDTLLRSANGVLGANRSTMYVLGAATGGILVYSVGSGQAIALDALTFALSALCLSWMHTHPAAVSHADRESFTHELREGFREVRRHRWLWMTLINAFLFLMLYVAPIHVLGPLVAQRRSRRCPLVGLHRRGVRDRDGDRRDHRRDHPLSQTGVHRSRSCFSQRASPRSCSPRRCPYP